MLRALRGPLAIVLPAIVLSLAPVVAAPAGAVACDDPDGQNADVEQDAVIMEGQVKADAKLDELTSTSAAVVSIERGPTNVEDALSTISGIHGVREEGPSNGFVRYRITAAKDMNLCPAIYDVARQQNWRLAELRPETRTLESVFRELAERGGISA